MNLKENKSGENVEWIRMVALFIVFLGVNVFLIWGIITDPVFIQRFIYVVFDCILNYWMFSEFQKIWIRIKMIRNISDIQTHLDNFEGRLDP